MSAAVRWQLSQLEGDATVSPVPLSRCILRQPSLPLNRFITLKMPLAGQAHLQQVEGRLICLCLEAKGVRGERAGAKRKGKDKRRESGKTDTEVCVCVRVYHRVTPAVRQTSR